MSVSVLRVSLLVAAVFAALTIVPRNDRVSYQWWNLGNYGLRNSVCPTCAQFLNNASLTQGQAETCYTDSAPIEAIASGSRSAIIECQARFADKQWNCSTFFGNLLFGKFVEEDSTRETGVLQAYFAAGAVKGVATACHNQKIRDCVRNFDDPVESTDEEGNLIYHSCKENTQYSINCMLDFIFPGLTILEIKFFANFRNLLDSSVADLNGAGTGETVTHTLLAGLVDGLQRTRTWDIIKMRLGKNFQPSVHLLSVSDCKKAKNIRCSNPVASERSINGVQRWQYQSDVKSRDYIIKGKQLSSSLQNNCHRPRLNGSRSNRPHAYSGTLLSCEISSSDRHQIRNANCNHHVGGLSLACVLASYPGILPCTRGTYERSTRSSSTQ